MKPKNNVGDEENILIEKTKKMMKKKAWSLKGLENFEATQAWERSSLRVKVQKNTNDKGR